MTVTELEIPGVKLIQPRVFRDDRGFFLEVYHAERYASMGLPWQFVQANHSHSRRNTLRGLHYQRRHPQGKLVRVARGEVLDVVLDIRPGSPTFGRHLSVLLSDHDHRQLWVPPGMAHGFFVLSEVADFLYACTDFYRPEDEGGIRWDDPDLGIEWPSGEPLLSGRDLALPRLCDLPTEDLPRVG